MHTLFLRLEAHLSSSLQHFRQTVNSISRARLLLPVPNESNWLAKEAKGDRLASDDLTNWLETQSLRRKPIPVERFIAEIELLPHLLIPQDYPRVRFGGSRRSTASTLTRQTWRQLRQVVLPWDTVPRGKMRPEFIKA